MTESQASRAANVTQAAAKDGLISGALMGIPSTFAVWTGMRYPSFVKATNWQSRTALAIMPPLFMYALASEQKINLTIKQSLDEKEHSRAVGKWATEREKIEQQHTIDIQQQRHAAASGSDGESTLEQAVNNLSSSATPPTSDLAADKQLHALYRKSVEESGVRIVPGDSLGIHHQMANFWQENPFKILAGVGVPTVLYIFKGKQGQKHLQLQSKLMHTRVYGQFAVLTMLLGLMGFKSYMDSWGKFVTEVEAEYRVVEMEQMRRNLIERIAFDRKLDERRQQMLRSSHKSSTSGAQKAEKKTRKEKKIAELKMA